MPDFGDAKYASYVQLCQELGLPRRLSYGDKYWSSKGPLRIGVVPFDSLGEADRNLVWLPTLADWLEMLETTGVTDVLLVYHGADAGWGAWQKHERNDLPNRPGFGHTREEAAARLWLAVTRPT